MKKSTRVLAFLLLLVTLLTSLIGCPAGAPDGGTTGSSATTGGQSGNTPSGSKQNYTVTVKSIGGIPLSGIGVYIYADGTLEDLEDYKATDENGTVTFSLKKSDTYHVKVAGVPQGYEAAWCAAVHGIRESDRT